MQLFLRTPENGYFFDRLVGGYQGYKDHYEEGHVLLLRSADVLALYDGDMKVMANLTAKEVAEQVCELVLGRSEGLGKAYSETGALIFDGRWMARRRTCFPDRFPRGAGAHAFLTMFEVYCGRMYLPEPTVIGAPHLAMPGCCGVDTGATGLQPGAIWGPPPSQQASLLPCI